MNGQEVAAVVLAVATLVSSLASLVVAIRTGQKASQTHDLVNGQSTALNEAIASSSEAAGRDRGRPGVMGKST